MGTPPVLLLIFNRPDTTSQVMDVLREVKPPRLYVAADGPRDANEAAVCAEALRVATYVDWDCTVERLVRPTNQGTRLAVSGGLDWFFEQEEEGVIIEDDCIPHPSFFPYCQELLDQYANDDRVGTISGNNFHPPDFPSDHSYSFTKYPFIWGWATWRRSWQQYDRNMSLWEAGEEAAWFRQLRPWDVRAYWRECFDRNVAGETDSWAYVWTLTALASGTLSIMPTENLVSNVGHGANATNTKLDAWPLGIPAGEIALPLAHPDVVVADPRLERWIERNVYRTRARSIRNRLMRVPGAESVRRVLRRPT